MKEGNGHLEARLGELSELGIVDIHGFQSSLVVGLILSLIRD